MHHALGVCYHVVGHVTAQCVQRGDILNPGPAGIGNREVKPSRLQALRQYQTTTRVQGPFCWGRGLTAVVNVANPGHWKALKILEVSTLSAAVNRRKTITLHTKMTSRGDHDTPLRRRRLDDDGPCSYTWTDSRAPPGQTCSNFERCTRNAHPKVDAPIVQTQ